MKFTCEKAILVSAVSIAARTVAQKSSISCLEGILLRVGVGVQLTGFNLETGITVQVDAAVSEPGVCSSNIIMKEVNTLWHRSI